MIKEYGIKLVKKLMAFVVIFGICFTPWEAASANSTDIASEYIATNSNNMKESVVSDINDLEEISQVTTVLNDGDYTITTVETVYEIEAQSVYATMAKASTYKSEFITKEWVVSYKGVKLISILLDAGFKYNGTYVYTNDGEYIVNKYNGSSFTVSKVNTTSKSNKSKTKAKYVVKGTIKNSKYGGNKDVTFKLLCTPTGKTSSEGVL